MIPFLPLLRIVLSLHCWADRAEPDWPARASTIAEAIQVVATDESEAGVLLAIDEGEALNSLAVHRGKITRDRRGQYRSLWQLSRRWTDSETWEGIAGVSLEATTLAASESIRIYRAALKWECHGDKVCAQCRYMGHCDRDKAVKRAKRAREFADRILAERKADE